MEHGDIGTWTSFQVCVVWEGCIGLADRHTGGILDKVFKMRDPTAVQWAISDAAVRSMIDLQRLNVACRIITFTSEDTVERIKELLRRMAPSFHYADVEYYEPKEFARMLSVTPDIRYVVDGERSRCDQWGWRAHYAPHGTSFGSLA